VSVSLMVRGATKPLSVLERMSCMQCMQCFQCCVLTQKMCVLLLCTGQACSAAQQHHHDPPAPAAAEWHAGQRH
jgi:hypothetical protein